MRIVTTLPYTEFTVATGNYDETRAPIDRVIIHTTDGTLQGAISRFSTTGTHVSAHYIIDTDGRIYHGLEETFTAYQAGDYAMNQRSIGIEHVDNGDYNGIRPDVLYQTSAKLVKDICSYYTIPIDRTHVLKHSEIIPTGCPDALDIERIVREANGPATDPLSQCNADRDLNYNVFVKVMLALGAPVDSNNKQASADRAVQIITDLKNAIPSPVPAPTPPSPPSTQPTVDYKQVLTNIANIAYGKQWWWIRLNNIKAELVKVGINKAA